MKNKTRRLIAEDIREQRELFQWRGPRTFRKKRVKVLKTLEKRVVVRRKIPESLTVHRFEAAREKNMKGAGSGNAARENLAAGNPIYYRKPDTPPGVCVKEYPDGRLELVRFDLKSGKEVVLSLAEALAQPGDEADFDWEPPKG